MYNYVYVCIIYVRAYCMYLCMWLMPVSSDALAVVVVVVVDEL